MFRRLGAEPKDLADLDRVEALVRARFGLGADPVVLVTEDRPRTPGLPDVDTTIRFWADRKTRHRLRIFKPAATITPDDLPARWLMSSLVDDGDGECC